MSEKLGVYGWVSGIIWLLWHISGWMIGIIMIFYEAHNHQEFYTFFGFILFSYWFVSTLECTYERNEARGLTNQEEGAS